MKTTDEIKLINHISSLKNELLNAHQKLEKLKSIRDNTTILIAGLYFAKVNLGTNIDNPEDWIAVKPQFKKDDYVWPIGRLVGEYIGIKCFANPEECKLLDDALAKASKHLNPKTMELEDIWQPKEGEIVVLKNDRDCVFAWRKGEYNTSFYAGVTYDNRVIIYRPHYSEAMNDNSEITPATPAQKKRFHDYLAKEGYIWNASTLKTERLFKVPENINIFKYGDSLSIGFNNNKQQLWYDTLNDVYSVLSLFGKKVKCKLVLCEKEDLKAGDIAYAMGEPIIELCSITRLAYYHLILDENKYCFIDNNSSISVSYDSFEYWYKIVPID